MCVISVFVPTMATPQGSKTRGSISYLCDDKYKDTQKDAKKCLAIMDNLCGIKMVRAILSKPLLLKNTPTATEAGKPGIGGWTCSPFWVGPVVYRKKQNIPLKLIAFDTISFSKTFQSPFSGNARTSILGLPTTTTDVLLSLHSSEKQPVWLG